MDIDTRIAAARRAIAASDWSAAATLLCADLGSVPERRRSKLIPLIETVADHDEVAALTLAIILANGMNVRANVPKAKALFTRLTRSSTKAIAGQSHGALASIEMGRYGGDAHWPAALAHCRAGADLDFGECAYNAGMILMDGYPGVAADAAAAEAFFRRAVAMDDEGAATDARTNLALLLVRTGQRSRFAEVEALLKEAAGRGDEKAVDIVESFDFTAEEAFDLLRASLDAGTAERSGETFHSVYWKPGDAPVQVAPVDTRRPRLVAAALMHEFGLDDLEARRVTAVVHGFATWDAMESCFDLNGPGTPDEDVDAIANQRREEYQTFVLRRELDQTYYVVEVALSLLKPTARTGTPSLARLEETMANRVIQTSHQEMAAQFGEVMKELGIEGNPADFLDRMRLSKPVRADLWLDELEDLGWKFARRSRKPTASHGDRVAQALDADGNKWPVFVTPIMGGDAHDVQAQELRKWIAGQVEDAVLLHTSCAVVSRPDHDEAGLVFGGSILKDGEWKDFCLTGGGLPQALRDFGRLDDDFDAYMAEHAVADAVSLARKLQGDGSELGTLTALAGMGSPGPK